MRTHVLIGTIALGAAAGCGLEGFIGGVSHTPYDRPASTIRGQLPWSGAKLSQLTVVDANGNAVEPFSAKLGQDRRGAFVFHEPPAPVDPGAYELRLPSASYAFLRVQARVGNATLRAMVPFVGEESTVGGVDLDAASMTEALIVEAWLSAHGRKLKQLTPSAYLGTRPLIRAAFGQAGPTQDLLRAIERIVSRIDLRSTALDPSFFREPVYDGSYTVVTSAVDPDWLKQNPFDYDGDGVTESDTGKLDALLAQVAQLYQPAGCPDPARVRVLFTVDFNAGTQDGNCTTVNRFKWAVDKPGKQMFFVGWVHKDSPVQDRTVDALLGAGVPNQIPMHDDGTNGDEVAGDGIWTVVFDLPWNLRLGYKYTWGTRGAPWTGSEEWPGNSRLLEVVDVNGDGFVYRRDVFGDEATNKDTMNLNQTLVGNTITWTTDLHGCGPEVHEEKYTLHVACLCGAQWTTPESVGPLTIACTGP